ncbi:BspA family leucine-rich repeat surface protein [Enterococcus gallinarum]|uniref:BspA family leucine-rich repeat surface protein n=1 Tax=Enterococcus gallinarum TaxID=1353 RepID=UPI00257F0E73|nr:BspA family leucine-rich repeat surface protein [Enterococcus gallinarum]
MLKNLSTVIIVGMSILTPFVGFNGFIVTEERSEEMVSSNNFLDENDKSDFDKNIVETEETGTSKTSKDNLPIIPAEEISKVNEESKFDTELPENKTTIESTGPEETKDGQKGLINGEVATYTWGSVSWTWDAATKTIELESGDAGKVVDAPWKKYPSVVKIIFKDKVVFPSDSSEMFFGALQDLEIIENGRNIDVSGVTNMSGMFMFDTEKYTSSLTELDVSSWDVSNVTDMSNMFSGAYSLANLDVSNWDVSSVTNMSGMFSGAYSLANLDVSNWDVSSVTDMSSMFTFAESLTELDVSKWDVSNVTDMRYMFGGSSSIRPGSSSLKKLDVSKWNVSSVTDMEGMFYRINLLAELDVSSWNVSSVTNMSYMFSETSSLLNLDVSKWDVSSVTNMNGLFYKASSLKELDISSFDMQNVETMWGLFTGTKLEKLTLGIENKFSADADLGVPYLSDSTPAEKWIRINGTNAVSPTELMNNYGNGDLIAGTYIAEREQLSISHFDPVTVSIGDEVTTSFNLNLNLYPTTREKGSIFNINYVLPSENLVEYDSSVKVRTIDSNEQVLETIFLPISLQKDGFTVEMKLSAEQLSAAKTINVVASGRAWNNTSGMNSASLEVEHPAWGGENVEVAKLAHEINHDFEITNGPIKIQNLPDQLNFDIKKLSNTLDGTLIDLKTNNFGLSILDYRGTNAISQTDTSVARQDWELFLTADDFIDQKNNVVNSDTLSLVYIKDGQNHEISSSDEVKIESHSVQGETAKDNHLHELSWKDEEGLKVCVKNKNNLKADWKYHSSITFELRQAP